MLDMVTLKPTPEQKVYNTISSNLCLPFEIPISLKELEPHYWEDTEDHNNPYKKQTNGRRETEKFLQHYVTQLHLINATT